MVKLLVVALREGVVAGQQPCLGEAGLGLGDGVA